ncbi:uncharacterized protein LOC132212628 [Myotis daubentonii]|uniref:uncharacterized protein LOC132212628 n=1 Tax=Myotis daubentonii TaxID=98922 RepID=UPI002873A510|nr:uncharacterized protein LOC132212628 [Myotis daubentonii]
MNAPSGSRQVTQGQSCCPSFPVGRGRGTDGRSAGGRGRAPHGLRLQSGGDSFDPNSRSTDHTHKTLRAATGPGARRRLKHSSDYEAVRGDSNKKSTFFERQIAGQRSGCQIYICVGATMRAAKGMVLRGTAAGRGPSGDATHLEGECGRPGQLGRKPTPGRRPCRLRAGSGRSCTRAELGRATSCLSPIAGLLGLPRRSQQKHWTGQEPAPRRQGRRAAARLRPPSLLLQKSSNPAGSVSASLGPSALIGERLAQARSPSVGGFKFSNHEMTD